MSGKDRFLPVDLERVTEDLLARAEADGLEPEVTKDVFHAWTALFQLELAEQLQRSRRSYHPFDPDAETIASARAPERDAAALQALCADLCALLERANFVRVPHAAVEAALNKTSPRGLIVHVDLAEFDVLEFHVRGSATRIDERRVVRGGLLRTERVETPIHRRLCVFAKFRGEEQASHDLASVATEDDLPRRDRVYVKLFRDVAHSDLEMLLPNTKVRMTAFDKLRLSVTGGGGTVGGLVMTATKIGAAAHPMTWGLALAGFGGVLWRQVASLVHTRVKYVAALARKLYTRNLDNNFGAITRITELARAEECKEALLAWYFLALRGDDSASLEELDRDVEAHLRARYALELDFDVADGLEKLVRQELCSAVGVGRWRALPPRAAREVLETAWKAAFRAP